MFVDLGECGSASPCPWCCLADNGRLRSEDPERLPPPGGATLRGRSPDPVREFRVFTDALAGRLEAPSTLPPLDLTFSLERPLFTVDAFLSSFLKVKALLQEIDSDIKQS